VSLLAASLVGPTGAVVGIDRNGSLLELARRRAQEAGFLQVQFEERSIDDDSLTQQFDAAIGRLVLIYQSDPAKALASVAKRARPGGIIAFIETDMSGGLRSEPESPLFRQVGEWITTAFARGNVRHDLGSRLFSVFLEAGLPEPSMRLFQVVVGGHRSRQLCQHYADTARSVLPELERRGIASAAEVGVETLAARLEADIAARHSQIYSYPMIAAWTQLPAG
jgi:SAM-dependent methyltransferase